MRAPAGLALLAALLLPGCAAPEPAEPEAPRVVAVLGDSISRAANAAAPGERPEHAWATGTATDDGVESVLERVRAERPDARGVNLARSGASMDEFPRQARLAVEQRPDLVLLLLGANDACRARVEDMTSEDAFRASLREGARILRDGLPDATVYVLSVPDVNRLWEVAHGIPEAQQAWRFSRACPALLSNASSEDDREAVRARVEAYNAALREESAAFGFRFDDGAVHAARFTPTALSRLDGFHPSLAGQAELARVAWEAGPYAEDAASTARREGT